MQVAEVPVVSARGKANLQQQIQKACLQLQVLQKVKVFFGRCEAGQVTDLITKTVETQLFGGITQPGKTVVELAPGGTRSIIVFSEVLGATVDGNLCVWRSNRFGTGWLVIPAKHIAVMSLNELTLFNELKLP